MAVLLVIGFAAGCSYSAKSLMPQGIRTVAVPVFDNLTFRELLELPLTRAVVQEIQTKTGLQVVEAARADSILEGTIADLEQRVLTEDLTDAVTEFRVTVVVDVIWRDRRTGEVLWSRTGLRESDEFRTPLGENLEVGQERAFDSMARRIVLEMEASTW
jgi:hypothetical protein